MFGDIKEKEKRSEGPRSVDVFRRRLLVSIPRLFRFLCFGSRRRGTFFLFPTVGGSFFFFFLSFDAAPWSKHSTLPFFFFFFFFF